MGLCYVGPSEKERDSNLVLCMYLENVVYRRDNLLWYLGNRENGSNHESFGQKERHLSMKWGLFIAFYLSFVRPVFPFDFPGAGFSI